MGDIQAQVAVGDVNGDGQLELISADARGNVAAFTAKAEELWERHVASAVSQVSAQPVSTNHFTLRLLLTNCKLLHPETVCFPKDCD